MPESIFAGLLHTLDKCEVSQISTTMGESEQRVSRGMESAVATVLAALTRQADHFSTLQSILDLAPEDLGKVPCSKLAASMSNPTCPWTAQGKNIVSALFGSNSDAIATQLGRESSVRPENAVTMLAMAALMTLSFLRRRVQDDALSMHGLGAILRQESGTIRSALPAGLTNLLWGRPAAATAVPAGVVPNRPNRQTQRSGAWIGTLGLALVLLGGLWIWSHAGRIGSIGPTATGGASRIAGEDGNEGAQPSGGLDRPTNEVEAHLLDTLGATDAAGHPSWVTFDRLRLASGSTKLSADSRGELDQIAILLKTHPKVHLIVAGFAADSSQGPRLGANAIKAALVARAVAPDRIVTQGMQEQGPLADAATPGQPTHSRIAMRVTQP